MIVFDMLSNKGGREGNEDYIGMYQRGEHYCFALADGLGGHGSGEVASKAAVDAVIKNFVQDTDSQEEPEGLSRRFLCAQSEILSMQRADLRVSNMRTTLVALEIGPVGAVWGHIGDSRLYLFEKGKVVSRTLDHSVPQMLVNAGELKEKRIRNHPDRNRVLRALGEPVEELRHELADTMPVRSGQAFLLCSDGFWELIEEKKMEACLKRADSPAQWLGDMEKIVLKNGRWRNMDNYSAIGVWIV